MNPGRLWQSIFAGVIALGASTAALAQTSNVGCVVGTRISGGGQNSLGNFLAGKTACFRPSGATDWDWQEFHQAGGALIDWKRGANHPTDPTKTVGSWSAGNGANGAVQYSYIGGAGPYTFVVCDVGGGSYIFQGVGGATTVGNATNGVTLKQGQGACP